ncbi:MAG: GMC family oxidoreductase [Gemmatimonadales bacterium]|jgi:choline dehydrogenase-like flavoprotein|nr:GMC family oxidoreductase [Gemmatimonadales bacterium]MDG2241467.1 GMC family oxidoreductase [Longimicrobiales bacterium]MBT3497742.1 GMC family oxidoreductase [Gemmatimonadales bacterium]MBT3773045.1 GMC family oxidoreductase [Gemmatimonadales bacterium]MBT3958528.1 GMC family oxidoreductase [Gemmatimonadales bacterium]
MRKKAQQDYDVIIVGSGAAGGMCAYVLACSGVKVLMLEAGRDYDPVTETPMFQMPKDAPMRGAGTPEKPFGFYDATVDGGWEVPGEPYSSAEGTDFQWWRARMLGGRTNHWGRISLRMGEYDYKPRQRDGLGFDWPMSYQDVEPYYDKTEMLIGVYGSNEGLENTPSSSPGVLQPAPAARANEMLTQHHCQDLDIPVIPAHLAILTERQDADRLSQILWPNNQLAQRVTADSMRSRAACFFATPCGRGCSIKANFQSPTVLLPPALATGNLDIITDAMVREVTVNAQGKATGVHYIDKTTRLEEHASARVVIVAASACESARILLNSKSSQFPDGIGNGSGNVGKYIMDTVGAGLGGQIPALENMPPHNNDGASAMHLYMPWWLYQQQDRGELDFARGYHIEFGGGRGAPGFGFMGGLADFTDGSYGTQFKEDCRRYYGSFMYFAGRGEMIPNEDCYAEIDPSGTVDQWGIPTLQFHWKWSDHELNQARHMQRTFADIIESMGGNVTGTVQEDGADAIAAPGVIIHEVGGVIMGAEPESSVLNEYCQSWEVDNLFVTDGGAFVSNADKNPTLSIMAIAWRASDYIVEQLASRSL